ncbi:MAG TPA: cytochrome c peroxidase [Candidatus Acidoferrales bacterium]|jgi:cytochrome c peroxidase|nr:cytochrome c peroxidase [Candidatus Acidoferrales bacterium]
MQRRNIMAGALALPAFLILGWAADSDAPPKVPLGLPAFEWPKDNQYSAAKVELGRYLYFDRRLSVDDSVSCSSCHQPEHGFTDGAPVSTGIKAQKGGRSAPTVINRAYSLAQFWDGRAASLEEQAKGPMANPIEMGNSHAALAQKLSSIAGYRALFAKAFGSEEVTIDKTAKAIACFERTVLSGNAPYDRYKRGDKRAMTPEQVRGMSVFIDKAKCDACHEGANFTLNAYANLGVGADAPEPDVGRYAVTKDPRDWGVFKTPTLREIEHTAPYMHDGSLQTLEDVVAFYDKGGIKNKNLDEKIKPLHLTDQNKKDLVAFLRALSGEGWQNAKAPAQFPQ